MKLLHVSKDFFSFDAIYFFLYFIQKGGALYGNR